MKVESIEKAFYETFEDDKIYLSGSHLDVTKRGEDIIKSSYRTEIKT